MHRERKLFILFVSSLLGTCVRHVSLETGKMRGGMTDPCIAHFEGSLASLAATLACG